MKPEVFFLLNAHDPTALVCRVVRRMLTRGSTVAICANSERLSLIDRALWSADAQSFVPHCRSSAPEPLRRYTPVLLFEEREAAPPAETLIHLGATLAPGWSGFERVVEIVGDDPSSVAEARQLWRGYTAHGCKPQHHDLSLRAGGADA